MISRFSSAAGGGGGDGDGDDISDGDMGGVSSSVRSISMSTSTAHGSCVAEVDMALEGLTSICRASLELEGSDMGGEVDGVCGKVTSGRERAKDGSKATCVVVVGMGDEDGKNGEDCG